jgi:hypothetical protein
VSELSLTLLAAVAGSVATYLFGHFRQIRDEFERRGTLIHLVRGDLTAAQQLIDTALASARLWPKGQQLGSAALRSPVGRLDLGDTERSELEGVVELLDAADDWADKLRQQAGDDTEATTTGVFVESLRILRTKLDGAVRIIDGELSNAKSGLTRSRVAGFAGVVLVAAVIAVPAADALFGGSAVSEGSLSRQLRAEIPASSRVICDASEIFDGSYRCAVEIPGCHGQLEASTSPPACANSPPHVDVLKVYADDDCYEATRFEQILSQLPSSKSPDRRKSTATYSGCVED